MDFEALFEGIWKRSKAKGFGPKTEMRYRQMFNLRIKDYFNRFKVEKITPLDIDGFFNSFVKCPEWTARAAC